MASLSQSLDDGQGYHHPNGSCPPDYAFQPIHVNQNVSSLLTVPYQHQKEHDLLRQPKSLTGVGNRSISGSLSATQSATASASIMCTLKRPFPMRSTARRDAVPPTRALAIGWDRDGGASASSRNTGDSKPEALRLPGLASSNFIKIERTGYKCRHEVTFSYQTIGSPVNDPACSSYQDQDRASDVGCASLNTASAKASTLTPQRGMLPQYQPGDSPGIVAANISKLPLLETKLKNLETETKHGADQARDTIISVNAQAEALFEATNRVKGRSLLNTDPQGVSLELDNCIDSLLSLVYQEKQPEWKRARLSGKAQTTPTIPSFPSSLSIPHLG